MGRGGGEKRFILDAHLIVTFHFHFHSILTSADEIEKKKQEKEGRKKNE